MKIFFVAFTFLIVATVSLIADENISLKQTSSNGLEGWTVAMHKNNRGYWMNSNLVIKDKSGKTSTFSAEYAFIDKWGFIDSDSAIVIRSINAHGPFYWQKFDIASRKLLEDFFLSKDPKHIPYWVKPFTEPNTLEQDAAANP